MEEIRDTLREFQSSVESAAESSRRYAAASIEQAEELTRATRELKASIDAASAASSIHAAGLTRSTWVLAILTGVLAASALLDLLLHQSPA